jgi:hypothetical protein
MKRKKTIDPIELALVDTSDEEKLGRTFMEFKLRFKIYYNNVTRRIDKHSVLGTGDFKYHVQVVRDSIVIAKDLQEVDCVIISSDPDACIDRKKLLQYGKMWMI